MSPQIVFAAYRTALVTNDLSPLADTLAADVIGYELNGNLLAGKHCGRHEVLAMIRRRHAKAGGRYFEIDSVISGSLLAALTATVPAARAQSNLPERHVDIFRVQDGAIVEAWMDWDRSR
ncbi:nuclear transport factor 2 family protein [Nocardia sp. NPDC006044]|uniref:nuclear transport factor 2 family protein n=1 Tax=Nocardia sp. NPDC006044 TaxID=3364306 RepID=UPI0036CF21E8